MKLTGGAALEKGHFTWITEKGRQERWVVASCGNYTVLWNFRWVGGWVLESCRRRRLGGLLAAAAGDSSSSSRLLVPQARQPGGGLAAPLHPPFPWPAWPALPLQVCQGG